MKDLGNENNLSKKVEERKKSFGYYVGLGRPIGRRKNRRNGESNRGSYKREDQARVYLYISC